MMEKIQELDEEYSELEDEYKEWKGHKYIPQTKGQKFTNDIRKLYYRLLTAQIPPQKIEEYKKF